MVGASLGEVHRDTGATGWRRRRKSRNPCGQGGEALCRCAVPASEQGTGHACPNRGVGKMPAKPRGMPAPEGWGGCWPASSHIQCGKRVGEATSMAAGLGLAPHTCGTKGG